MGDTARIKLTRYPDPPDLEGYLRVYFKLGEIYDVPLELAKDLVEAGDAVPEDVEEPRRRRPE